MSETLDYKLPEHLTARRAAMQRERTVQIVAVVVMCLCLAGAGLLLDPINRIRKERELIIDPDSIGGLPPDLALMGKLGTFRALAIDWASIRAGRLQDEGKTYEAMQLSQTICRLAPRFPSIWVNASWNMAYNISVMQYTPEARWQWVRNGIELLRDQGIKYNPKALMLYKELSWTYWHKIGDFLDDEHLNYKRALATEMETVLGAPPVALTTSEYLAWFQQIVDADRDLDHLLETDAEVAKLAFQLKQHELDLDQSLLEFVARNLRPEMQVTDLVLANTDEGRTTVTVLDLLNSEEVAKPLERLLAAVRSKALREQYNLDLDFMWSLMSPDVNGIGEPLPLDWRNAFSHSLYWSAYGDVVAGDAARTSLNDRVMNARFIIFGLQTTVMRGKITLWPDFDNPFNSHVDLTPDTRVIPYLHATYLKIGRELFGNQPGYVEGSAGPNFHVGFVNAMHQWIHLLVLEGGQRNRDLAEKYYTWLRDFNPHPNGTKQEQYTQPLDVFVMGEIIDRLQTYKAAHAMLRNLIARSLKRQSLGQIKQAEAAMEIAYKAYRYWMDETTTDYNDRRKMQPWGVVVRDETEAYLLNPYVRPLAKAMLWKHLSLARRQDVYDRVAPYFLRICSVQEPPWDATRAFPEPIGMDAVRQRDIEYAGERQEGVDAGTRDK